MGMFWTYETFDEAKWASVFGAGQETYVRDVVASMVWDLDGWDQTDLPDPDHKRSAYLDEVLKRAPRAEVELARRLVHEGISYAGLLPAEARRMDGIVTGFFAQEGIPHLLDVRSAMRDGQLSMEVARELVARGAPPSRGLFGPGGAAAPLVPTTLAPILVEGRRFGTQEASKDQPYFMLSASEIPLALAEVGMLVATPTPWSIDEFRQTAEGEIRGALRVARDANRALFGGWG
jgi:hypothetical protein